MSHSVADHPSSPTFELRPGTFADRSVVDRLMELYLYDCSEFDGYDVDEHGLYRYDDLDYYWMEKDREVLVLKVEGKWAGIALISTETLLDGNERSMDNFFIMRKYRRRGLGMLVAQAIFDRTPANWELCVLAGNTPATHFWRRTLAEYTDGEFREEQLDNEDWTGPVFSFSNRDTNVSHES
jgi:predicted acetyltransferase